jgi:hypothetical protein
MSANNTPITGSMLYKPNTKSHATGKASYTTAITLRWDYKATTVDLSMPGYIERALHKFHHQAPYRPEHAPHAWNAPVYGKNPQLTAREDVSTPLDKKASSASNPSLALLCSTRAQSIQPPSPAAIGSISAEQSKATDNTNKKLARLLDYFATHPNPTIRYRKSGMVLYIHSDASYLSKNSPAAEWADTSSLAACRPTPHAIR